MTRCEAFYEKWKRNPNWCGKCKTSVFRINRYIELTEEYPELANYSESTLRPIIERRVPNWELEKLAEKLKELREEGKWKINRFIVYLALMSLDCPHQENPYKCPFNVEDEAENCEYFQEWFYYIRKWWKRYLEPKGSEMPEKLKRYVGLNCVV